MNRGRFFLMKMEVKIMTNFEKMAIQFECCGDIFAVPGIEDAMNKVVEKDISRAERSGNITKAIGICMHGAPEAMKRLAAIETGKTEQEVEEMKLGELSAAMAKVFTQYILPFFGSGAKQDGGK